MFLDGKSYFAGDKPTIADVSILSTYIMFTGTFTDYGELPNLSAWFKRCQSLPGFEENISGTKAVKDMMAAKSMAPISMN